VHGQARRTTLGGRQVVLYPLYHPAAALYNPRLRPELEADVRRIPALLEHLAGLEVASGDRSGAAGPVDVGSTGPPPAGQAAPAVTVRAADQLELF
jgi:hypothetical protein